MPKKVVLNNLTNTVCVLRTTYTNRTPTFCHMPGVELMYDVRILFPHDFPYGWMSVGCNHLYVQAFIQEPLQTFFKTHWLHGNRTSSLGHLLGEIAFSISNKTQLLPEVPLSKTAPKDCKEYHISNCKSL